MVPLLCSKYASLLRRNQFKILTFSNYPQVYAHFPLKFHIEHRPPPLHFGNKIVLQKQGYFLFCLFITLGVSLS